MGLAHVTSTRHPRSDGKPACLKRWMPAFAGMIWVMFSFCLARPLAAVEIIPPPDNAPKKNMNFNRATAPAKPDKAHEALPRQQTLAEVKTSFSEQEKATLARIETYLNSFKTMDADFTQTNADGLSTMGRIYLARPGKLRLEYAPPNKNLLVADGTFVHVWDDEARTSSSVPLGTSLADVILRKEIKLSGDITVTGLQEKPGMLSLALVQTGNPALGTLTLEFEDRPLRLRNWRVLDAQGYETRVALQNERTTASFPSSLFFYRDPAMGKK